MYPPPCPKCGSKDINVYKPRKRRWTEYTCRDCRKKWSKDESALPEHMLPSRHRSSDYFD
jgi:transposase-like protein